MGGGAGLGWQTTAVGLEINVSDSCTFYSSVASSLTEGRLVRSRPDPF